MAKHWMYDIESGKLVGELDVPDDVMVAAARVSSWMRNFHEFVPSLTICGLQLVTEQVEDAMRKAADARDCLQPVTSGNLVWMDGRWVSRGKPDDTGNAG